MASGGRIGNAVDCLVVIYAKKPTLLGKRFVLEHNPTRVGRLASSHILLDEDSVSRRHAYFEQRANAWFVVDDGSANGTYCNDEQISHEVLLKNGDQLKISTTIFQFISSWDAEACYDEETAGLSASYLPRKCRVALLPHKQILKLHAAVVSAHLTGSRDVLLGGIDPAFAHGLPTCTDPSSQILSDLHGLNAAGRLGDGAVPLTIWLANALALVGQRAEVDVFRSALAVTESTEAPAHHAGRQGAPERVDEIAEELSRIGRAVLVARGDDLMRCLYEVDALLARCPLHVEARMLRARIQRAVEEMIRRSQEGRRIAGLDEKIMSRMVAGLDDVMMCCRVSDSPAAQLRLRAPLDFTGRERELGELMGAIGPGGVAISGLEGVGKTALALKLAELLAPRYPDLQIAIDLKGTSQEPRSPADVMVEVVRMFHYYVPLPEDAESIANLADLYHALFRGQRGLIVLDDARDRAQVEPLLPLDGSAVVVTSRRRFALPGAHVLSLDTLASSDAHAFLKRLAPRLDDQAKSTIAELCGGLPFALRLAGRALSNRLDLSPEAYAERLRDAQARHTIIDAAISVNFSLLDASLQALWCRLGLLAADFTETALRGLIEFDVAVTREALRDLVGYGLLAHEPGTERYSLQKSARRFAISRLREAARVDTERWRVRPDDSSSSDPGDDDGLQIPDPEGMLARALSAARRSGHRFTEAFYLEQLGDIHARSDSDYRAIEPYEQALAIFRELGDQHGEGGVLSTLKALHQRFDDNRRYIKALERYASVSRAEGNLREVADASWRIAGYCQSLGELDKAIEARQACVDIKRTLGLNADAERHAADLTKLRASLKK